MYKRILLMVIIISGVGLLLGYGREVLADVRLPNVHRPIAGNVGQQSVAMEDPAAMVLLSETIKLLAPNPAVGGWYGRSVLIDDSTLFVGETRSGMSNVPGRVYVYERHAGGPNNWGLTKVITPSDGTTQDNFGTALAIDEDTLIVGAFVGTGNASQSGTAYIYERNAGGQNNWGEVAKLQALDGAFEDRFGWTVDIDGDTAVVGARWDNNSGGTNAGAVYFFERNAGGTNNWGQVRKVMASDASAGDYFGTSVGIYEDTVIVGAPRNSDTSSISGAVYILERDQGSAGNWGEVTKLTSNFVTANDEFGRWVAIEGDLVVSGAHQPTGDGPGYAVIHGRDQGGPNNWGEITQLLATGGMNGDEFGVMVGLEGSKVYVGAYLGDGLTTNSGAAYIFEPDISNPGTWVETYKLVASDGSANDEFGYDLSVSGNSFVVGAFRNDDACSGNCNSGSAYLFTPILPIDLAIEKTVSNNTAVPGQPITYTLTFTNNGPDMAFGTVITDLVPTTILNPTFTSSGAAITSTGSSPFVWQVADMAPGGGGIITVTGIISPELIIETTIVNTAVISTSQDITPTNNSSTAVTQVVIPQVNLSAADYVVDENGGAVTVTAVLSPAQPFLDVMVNYETMDGSAISGEDYTGTSGILTFPAGTSSATVVIPILDDQLVETDETFTVILSIPVHATMGGTPEAVVLITDDDTYPTASLSASGYTVPEDVGTAVVTVTLNQPYPQPVSLVYETADGTAVAGSDYTLTTGTLTLTAGITQTSFTIPITDDLLVEGDETLMVSLTSFSNSLPGVPITAVVTITDNDEEPPISGTTIYLPIILRPAPTPPPPAFPIWISSAVTPRPVLSQGEIFYTATITVPAALPSAGQFFLSASSDDLLVISVDDELAFVLDGEDLFVKRFSLDGQTIYPEIVPIPRQTLSLMAGQTVTVVFRDVFGDQVSATPIWLIWVP